ncbi:spore cortex biosynthesis protein YabQ [Pseudobacillus wudalianchiensis]|uniref:Spore cortex biosynthesis protein YabQ n=1 Tax=Pseudobacillus wudalianchiensis TaxID=1743143 RepID=A0A1B9B672_9BACI|nr:spore cortex biosynthesis protein YabQ [Bacillus wudalianchiensis]OCA91597.1 spore cortex biosynthesis protein YabQ [Bacillus wudalianchiensis]
MTLTVQFETLLSMIAMGIFFGALLDTYQRFLKRQTRPRVISFFTDILFWCVFGLLIFYCLYQVNFGEVRLYLFLALLCGYSAYQALFKGFYMRLLEQIILTIVNIFLFLKKCFYFLIILPIKLIIKAVITIATIVGQSFLLLAKTTLSLLLWIGKIVFSPILLIWRFFPEKLQKKATNLKEKLAGFFLSIKNKVMNQANRWKK